MLLFVSQLTGAGGEGGAASGAAGAGGGGGGSARPSRDDDLMEEDPAASDGDEDGDADAHGGGDGSIGGGPVGGSGDEQSGDARGGSTGGSTLPWDFASNLLAGGTITSLPRVPTVKDVPPGSRRMCPRSVGLMRELGGGSDGAVTPPESLLAPQALHRTGTPP